MCTSSDNPTSVVRTNAGSGFDWTHVDVSLMDLIYDDVTDASDSGFKLPQQNTFNRKHSSSSCLSSYF